MRIRNATGDDVAQMTAIVNAAFAVETFLEGPRTDEARMAEAVQTGEFLVAEDDERRVTGCVRVERDGAVGRFGMLAVDPDAQGKGIGRAMVQAAEDRCRVYGCKRVDIRVLSLRPELLPFYRRLGYAETGTEPFRATRPLAGGAECHFIILTRAL